MVSIAPNSQSYDYKHMYFHPDIRLTSNTQHSLAYNKYNNSITGFLHQNAGFSKFLALVKKANMEDILSEEQANITIFIPRDDYLGPPVEFFESMDIGLARHLVNFATINRKIDTTLLTSSPNRLFITHSPSNKLNVTVINNIITIHGCTRMIKSDIEVDNGLIHIVNNLLIPESMMSYVYGP